MDNYIIVRCRHLPRYLKYVYLSPTECRHYLLLDVHEYKIFHPFTESLSRQLSILILTKQYERAYKFACLYTLETKVII